MILILPIFGKFQGFEPILTMKFVKFCDKIFTILSTTHNLSKTLLCIKFHPQISVILTVLWQKPCKICTYVCRHQTVNITDIGGWNLMQSSVLERLWVVFYMIKNLTNFTVKFGSKSEICRKLEELKRIFLNNSEVSSYLLGHILLFWKVKMQRLSRKHKKLKISTFRNPLLQFSYYRITVGNYRR